MTNRGQNSNLVDCVVDLSVRKADEFDFFQGIDGLVDQSFDLIYTRIGPFSQFGQNLKICHRHLSLSQLYCIILIILSSSNPSETQNTQLTFIFPLQTSRPLIPDVCITAIPSDNSWYILIANLSVFQNIPCPLEPDFDHFLSYLWECWIWYDYNSEDVRYQ